MEEGLRRQYLQAMGITVWERRDPPSAPIPESERKQAPIPPDAAVEEQPSAVSSAEAEEEVSKRESAPPVIDEEPPVWEEAPPWTETPAWHEDEAADDDIARLDWDGLRSRVKACRACGLRAGCTQTVFGVGSPNAQLMVIGEAPGADEDRQGEPFVGRAGQLLNAMLLAIGFKREQVFIANILKCRPPNNRDPKAEEALQCEPYLLRQIALVQPKIILSVGRISAQNLLKTEIPVGKLRGRLHSFGQQRTPLVVTYHPAYLLRSPEQKGKAWEDLQLALAQLRNTQS
jgi:DNA polymerase